ncbi:MAG: hypothetical protein JWP89_6936 [Schlesneria sp.]|nr:hypothetical protein [Schlesneria sp.]
MWFSNRRFEKVVTTVAAGLLMVASLLLILRRPPSDSTRVQGRTAGRNNASPQLMIAAQTDCANPADALNVTNSEFGSTAVPSLSVQMSKDVMTRPMIIRKLPLTEVEIETAWKQAAASACELLRERGNADSGP